MTGTLLATILSPLIALLGAYVLFAPKRDKSVPEAKPTRKRHEVEYVTRDELKEALEEVTKELNYEWNEWYEKFDKLHLRLAKRAAREQKKDPQIEFEESDAPAPVSVLNFRRVGSV